MIRRAWLQMGMPITVCIQDDGADELDVAAVESWFEDVNRRFSPFLDTSEVSRLNAGLIQHRAASPSLREILRRCDETRAETNGWFDAVRDGVVDPSGLVKGWAIERASELLTSRGHRHHFVDAGGDVQTSGARADGEPWRVGIRNPFNHEEIVKVLAISGGAVATSGTAARGRHIYDPLRNGPAETDLVSMTVVARSIFDADRMATAAFAMGRSGLRFIAEQPGLEGYAIHENGTAEFTEGFSQYVR